MNVKPTKPATGLQKCTTGIEGFDAITAGGLPSGRTTLLVGGPGSGKTIFALKFLVHGAAIGDEPGLFVAFEESADRIVANAEGFGWNLAALRDKELIFIDAQPSPDLVQSGDFDLGGMLAVLGAQASKFGVRRIVLDALDVVLALLPDEAAKRRELYRLHAWLLEQELTCVITAKSGGDTGSPNREPSFSYLQFMVDCAVVLKHQVITGISQRNLRVQKYRGSSFDENESPFLIGKSGFEISVSQPLVSGMSNASKERVSSGVERLDTMLGGGYYRGACILITGFPGTAKTTLSGTFAEAACLREERTLFVSFDADSNEVVRDLTSVGIHLGPHLESGCLRMFSARTVTGSAESHLVRIKTLAMEHGTKCVVIDPVSTWTMAADRVSAHGMSERLIDWSKSEGITLFCTSQLDDQSSAQMLGTSLQVLTLADTWIHVDYLMQAGERNRSLSIIKSRGTAHSNQVRELILSDSGVTLADIYTAGGDVLMGTQRWEKERADLVAVEEAEIEGRLKRVRLDAEEAELEVRVKSLQTELVAKQVEKSLLARTTEKQQRRSDRGDNKMRELRGADPTDGEDK